jgi:N-acetylmuramic acid 6-phosphate etherase
MSDYLTQAEHFINCETQFHLGMLPTEQPHPGTRGLAETLQADCAAGLRLLQAVDQDVVAMARRVQGSAAMARLVAALSETFAAGHRVCFSGCGATGRLSIMLEAMWRHYWLEVARQQPSLTAIARRRGDQVISIMTGGDYALIRSVEGFEDYLTFGRQQVREAGLAEGDVLVAISEGGETSSVIGTLHEARARGVKCFFVFNNPAEVLSAHIQRSREVITDPQITVLDLTTGPMAVTGSTRMQATTAELLITGTALELALTALWPTAQPPAPVDLTDPAGMLAELLKDLGQPAVIEGLQRWVKDEQAIYETGGRLTYLAKECLLDIFTDTTERAPTFMLPPFRRADDHVSPPSWAFVKDPCRPTPAAWHQVLGRPPRCLHWQPADYEALGALPDLVASPPDLSEAQLLQFTIGHEADPSRTAVAPNLALAILLGPELPAASAPPWQGAMVTVAAPFERHQAVVIGEPTDDLPGVSQTWQLPCRLPATPLKLWHRLAAKLILNTVSTATMGRMGRLVSNWMANVECSNKKLIDRGTRLVAELTGLEYGPACRELHYTIARQQAAAAVPGQPRRSPVAVTIERLRGTSKGREL